MEGLSVELVMMVFGFSGGGRVCGIPIVSKSAVMGFWATTAYLRRVTGIWGPVMEVFVVSGRAWGVSMVSVMSLFSKHSQAFSLFLKISAFVVFLSFFNFNFFF